MNNKMDKHTYRGQVDRKTSTIMVESGPLQIYDEGCLQMSKSLLVLLFLFGLLME